MVKYKIYNSCYKGSNSLDLVMNKLILNFISNDYNKNKDIYSLIEGMPLLFL